MKKDIMPPANQEENESGVPVQLKILLGALIFAVVAIVLKLAGVV